MTTIQELGRVRIVLDGRLGSDDLPLVADEMHGHRRAGHPIEIDLSGVTFADAVGSRFLLDLSRSGAALRRPSPYLPR